MGRPPLENIMMSQLSLTYGESRKLVLQGRESLGMGKFAEWTDELEAECVRLYEASGGTVKIAPKPKKEDPVKVEPKKVASSPAPVAKPVTPEPVKQPEPEPAAEPEPEPAAEEPASEEPTPEPEKEEEEAPAPEPEKEEVEEPTPEPKAEEEEAPAAEEEAAAAEPAKPADNDSDSDSNDDE